jgi:PTH2 family peptidyl-tRNA hydrolase
MESLDVKQVIIVRKDLNMRKGKLAAQVAHASMASILRYMEVDKTEHDRGTTWSLFAPHGSPLYKWLTGPFKKIVVGVDSLEELQKIKDAAFDRGIQTCVIEDAGFTEFHGVPTITAMSVGPDWSIDIDEVTGHLPLL